MFNQIYLSCMAVMAFIIACCVGADLICGVASELVPPIAGALVIVFVFGVAVNALHEIWKNAGGKHG